MSHPFSLEGKVALVTGAGAGLGADFAHALATQGAAVVVADRKPAAAVLERVQRDISGARIADRPTDVSDESQVKALVDSTISTFGAIDIVVNNAAVFSGLASTAVTEIDVELWDRIMAVNVRGPFLLAKHAAPHMIAKRRGKIINIASGVAYKGMAGMVHYATSKGAVVTMTRSLARELGAHNINVNSLAPGLIMSETISANEGHIQDFRAPVLASRSIKRDGFPGDLLGALVFLASEASDFVTGQTIAVDGGSVNL
jgi:NAD(P)-dependent dehydrogenase (short-subunit alcohol dehydrogenase family)